jgi:cytochrome P450
MIKTLFGHNFKDDTGELADAITTRRRYFEYTLSSIFPFPEYVPLPIVHKHRQAIKIIDEAIYGAIHSQRDTTVLSGGLLSRLMEARYEDGTGMNDKQVRDEALTFLNTGYETIGAALAWTLYLLSLHPEIESKLLVELHEVSNGRFPCVEDLSKLRYAAMVLSESMRLYPPTWMFVRVARQSDTLPSGANVPAGTKLYLCPYVTHRHPCYFPEPERFDPERFSARGKQGRPRFAYFPFGGGSRKCIGEAFARMEGVLVLASIVQRFKLTLLPGQTIVPEAGIFLRPKNGILMQVEQR